MCLTLHRCGTLCVVHVLVCVSMYLALLRYIRLLRGLRCWRALRRPASGSHDFSMINTNLHHEDGGRASVAGIGDVQVRPYGCRLTTAIRLAAAAAAARPRLLLLVVRLLLVCSSFLDEVATCGLDLS